jgi:hypothetical protein
MQKINTKIIEPPGFTLIEFLMATGITLVIAIGLCNLFYGALNHWYKKSEYIRIQKEAYHALEILKADMSCIVEGEHIYFDKKIKSISWLIQSKTGELKRVIYTLAPIDEFPNIQYPEGGGCLYRMIVESSTPPAYDWQDALLAPVANMNLITKKDPYDESALGIEFQLDLLDSKGQLYAFTKSLPYRELLLQ